MGSAAAPSIFWFVARGSGMAAFILLSVAVALGITVSRHWYSERWPRLTLEAAHRWTTLTFVLFIIIHTVTILLDPFTHFTVPAIAIPFVSTYRTLWMALGIIASELALAIAASALIRRWIGYRVWHALHLLTYLLFPLSLLHGLGTGTDTQTLWATVVYAVGMFTVIGAAVWRTTGLHAMRRLVLVGSAVGALALLLWAENGPYAAGWARAAGTPTTLIAAAAKQRGAPAAAAASSTPSVPALPTSLQDQMSGNIVTGNESMVLLRGTGLGTDPVDVAVQLARGRRGFVGQVQLRTQAHLPLCSGPITSVSQSTVSATCAGYGQSVNLRLTFSRLDANGFSGLLSAGGQGSTATSGTGVTSSSSLNSTAASRSVRRRGAGGSRR